MESSELLAFFPLIPLSSDEWVRLLPFIFLSLGGIVGLIFSAFKIKGKEHCSCAQSSSFTVLMISVIASLVALYVQPSTPLALSTNELFFDAYSRIFSVVLLFCTLGVAVISYRYNDQEDLPPELFSLLSFATIGTLLMVSTQSLMMMFIGVECMSLAVYVLVAIRRTSRYSSEASIKYFILGGVASGMMLYGIALIFGATGTFQLGDVYKHLELGYQLSPLFHVGVGLLLISLLFKVGAAPLHAWIPDVYQGAANNVTAFMMSSVKLASMVVLAKVMLSLVFPVGVESIFYYPLWVVAALTVLLGNIMALVQVDLKRILAYSSIAHTGYLLIGLLVAAKSGHGIQSVYFYLIMYVLLNIGVMAVCIYLSSPKVRLVPIQQFQGLFFRHPLLAICIIVPLLAMAGIPLTSGFMGKVALFSMAIDGGELPLTLIALFGSIISAVYYIRIFILMFHGDREQGASYAVSSVQILRSPWALSMGLIVVFLTLFLGLFPQQLWKFLD